MRRKILVFVCVLVIALMVASTVPVGAEKGGKPGKPGGGDDGGGSSATGTIFFHRNSVDPSIYTMNADGSSKTSTGVMFPGKWSMSILKHGEHYWYVGFEETTGTHPDGTFQVQLKATRDDDSNTAVLLDDTTMAYDSWNGPPVCLTDDAYISWAGLKWESGTAGKAGIYKGEITWTDGIPSMSTPDLVWSTGTYYRKYNGLYTPNVRSPNWTADMNKLVMSSTVYGMIVVDMSAEPDPKVVTTVDGFGTAMFSPDGSKLIQNVQGDLYVMNSDGTSRTTLVNPKSTHKSSKGVERTCWSPDSKFITYTLVTSRFNPMSLDADVYVIGVDGSGNKCLTGSINQESCWSREWR